MLNTLWYSSSHISEVWPAYLSSLLLCGFLCTVCGVFCFLLPAPGQTSQIWCVHNCVWRPCQRRYWYMLSSEQCFMLILSQHTMKTASAIVYTRVTQVQYICAGKVSRCHDAYKSHSGTNKISYFFSEKTWGAVQQSCHVWTLGWRDGLWVPILTEASALLLFVHDQMPSVATFFLLRINKWMNDQLNQCDEVVMGGGGHFISGSWEGYTDYSTKQCHKLYSIIPLL